MVTFDTPNTKVTFQDSENGSKLGWNDEVLQAFFSVHGLLLFLLKLPQACAEADTFFCFVELLSGFRDNFCQQLDNSVVGIRSTISRLSQFLKEHDEELWCHLEITTKVIHTSAFFVLWKLATASPLFSSQICVSAENINLFLLQIHTARFLRKFRHAKIRHFISRLYFNLEGFLEFSETHAFWIDLAMERVGSSQ